MSGPAPITDRTSNVNLHTFTFTFTCTRDTKMKKTYTISGMSCNHCVMAVKKEFSKIENLNVLDVRIGAAEVEFDPALLDEQIVTSAITAAGYIVNNK